jgi:ribose-phosphate pyrophosphokinase
VLDASAVRGKECLILDDICDGGGTFTGLATELHKAEAQAVDLFVTHGIFSKGGTLEGIRQIFTTDSYHPIGQVVGPVTFHVKMGAN